jgi:cell division protein FtsZ
MFEPISESYSARLAVMGIGGGGCNATNRMVAAGLKGVTFYALNTDLQALSQSRADHQIQLGDRLTNGLGSGGNPMIGRKACEESLEAIKEIISELDMVFLAAGEGGGTGTGATPLIAEAARSLGVLTVAIVTRPFEFEGRVRAKQAQVGIEELKDRVDTLIVIPNQRLLSVVKKEATVKEAFAMVDEVLLNATQGIADLITTPGLINLDFADVRTIMAERGHALMGTGRARAENRAVNAAQAAIASPLIDDLSIRGAKGALLNITGGSSLTIHEVSEACSVISGMVSDEANIIFGAVCQDGMDDEVKVTVIATGIEEPPPKIPEVYDLLGPESAQLARQLDRRQAAKVEPRNFSKDDLEIPTFLRRQLD